MKDFAQYFRRRAKAKAGVYQHLTDVTVSSKHKTVWARVIEPTQYPYMEHLTRYDLEAHFELVCRLEGFKFVPLWKKETLFVSGFNNLKEAIQECEKVRLLNPIVYPGRDIMGNFRVEITTTQETDYKRLDQFLDKYRLDGKAIEKL